MTLRLHNNLTRQVESFAPLDPGCPTMYLCGPTVYNYVHIGNARGPVVFGVLAELLRRRFGGLRYARNITDIDDKINAAARELGVPIATITDKYAAAYREDMAGLGVVPQDLQPEATAHVLGMDHGDRCQILGPGRHHREDRREGGKARENRWTTMDAHWATRSESGPLV